MAFSTNPKVRQAYHNGEYADVKGDVWKKGMDGWFLDDAFGPDTVALIRHDEFVAVIEKEHPIEKEK